ncbi:MAG: AI-2E family transporter [Lachnospiraceae bacterium]|nr:AI-2E family transporter [Lachnospiraceae bacterium]
MKFKWDKKYLYWGVTALVVLSIVVLFNFLLNQNVAIRNAIAALVKILLPIILGFVIAFLVNPLMKWFEVSFFTIFDKKAPDRRYLPKWKKNLYRVLSMVFSYLFILILLACFIIAVIPQISDSIVNISILFPKYKENFLDWFNNLTLKYPEVYKYLGNYIKENEEIINDWTDTKLVPWLTQLASKSSVYLLLLFQALKDFVIGFIVSIYVLSKKELFKGQAKKIVYSIFNAKNGNVIIKNVRMASDKFAGFIIGKIVDSFIIGILCFIGCQIMRVEYPVLLALIIGVTNIIPFFGPIIGAIPCLFLLLVINPLHALYFLIFVIILQQLDGNFIGPKILGSSTGISSFWVIFAITVFGGFWGIPGMIIGVPLMAVIYTLIQSALDITLRNKELSRDTDDYIYLDHIDLESKEFIDKELPSVELARKKAEKAALKEQKRKDKEEKRLAKENAKKESENTEKVENKTENDEKQ